MWTLGERVLFRSRECKGPEVSLEQCRSQNQTGWRRMRERERRKTVGDELENSTGLTGKVLLR